MRADKVDNIVISSRTTAPKSALEALCMRFRTICTGDEYFNGEGHEVGCVIQEVAECVQCSWAAGPALI